MGLFDKKYCDICGEKIGLLGNRKLADGNLCKNCAGKLSPFFSERKQSTVAEIRDQLAYREENRAAVERFRVDRTLGRDFFIFIDSAAGKFMANRRKNYADDNPDVIPLDCVTGVSIDTDQNRSELKRKDKDGKEVSYMPPRYEYRYEVKVAVSVRNPYFNEISFRTGSNIVVNGTGREIPDPARSVEYREAMDLAQEIKAALTAGAPAAEAAEPVKAVVCPHCGATTIPDAKGCCEYCGGSLAG